MTGLRIFEEELGAPVVVVVVGLVAISIDVAVADFVHFVQEQ